MAGGEGIPGITLDDIEQFFFDAPGYDSGAEKITIPELPGDKIIRFRHGLWEMIDQYSVSPDGPWSAGVYKIRYNTRVVWVMHYGGQYPEEVIPFLKFALLQTRRSRQFFGGRGPLFFPNPGGTLVYVNSPEINDFFAFRGKEQIFDVRIGKPLGFHDYWGMSTLNGPGK